MTFAPPSAISRLAVQLVGMAESAAELQANLAEYREQLQQLEDLLLDEPDNADYQSLFNDVQEVCICCVNASIQTCGDAALLSIAPHCSERCLTGSTPVLCVCMLHCLQVTA